MDTVIIAQTGVEGGGITIYGSQSNGVWSFWTEGTSMDFDEKDDEVWRSWSSKPDNSVNLLVPHDWPVFYPSMIHPGFVGWFPRSLRKGTSVIARRPAPVPS